MQTIARLLTVFCPMHVRADATGHIVDCGPTLQKLRPDLDLRGRRLLELFELNRPRSVTSVQGLLDQAGTRLHLQFRDPPRTALQGVAVALPQGEVAINLSLGISVVDAVRDYTLTGTDFAATDPTVEMLFLVEANAAAMEASRMLNQRLQGAKIAAEEQAFTDTLTGLKNRRALDHVLARLRSAETSFALLHLDLDYFKAINDTLGHAAGDHVLQQVAQRMVQETRDKDTVARVGGDEFVLILGDIDDRKRLQAIARRMIDRLEEPIRFGGDTCQVSASIGIALSNQHPAAQTAQLINAADSALYAAKDAGRGCFRFYEPDSAADSEPAMHQGLRPANDRRRPANRTGRGADGSAR